MPSRFAAALRFVIALLILISIVWQITDRLLHNLFRPGEYFAYFTIQSSMIAAVALAVTGWFAATGKTETKTLSLVRLSVACFASVTGIVYNALLRGMPPVAADAGYNWPVPPNEILHVWAPILIALDFVVFAPPVLLKLRAGIWVWGFPLAWAIFSVIRGLATGWWPYWFINPTGPAGVPGMLEYVFGIMVFLFLLSVIFLGLTRLRTRVWNRA